MQKIAAGRFFICTLRGGSRLAKTGMSTFFIVTLNQIYGVSTTSSTLSWQNRGRSCEKYTVKTYPLQKLSWRCSEKQKQLLITRTFIISNHFFVQLGRVSVRISRTSGRFEGKIHNKKFIIFLSIYRFCSQHIHHLFRPCM